MITIAVTNQKGGVGKTTCCVNLSAELGRLGHRVLVVDTDPQGNCSSGLGHDRESSPKSLYDILIDGSDIQDVVVETPWEGVSLVPANINLAGAEVELSSAISRESRLKGALSTVEDLYDIAIVDCPPSLGLLTVNALVAAKRLLIPIQCEYYALEGVGQLARTVDLVRQYLNPNLNMDGVVLTMFDSRTRLANDVVTEVREGFGDAAFETLIPRNVTLSEAPSYGKPISYYQENCKGALAYRDLAREVEGRWLKEDL
ncbi:Cobyrinic acid ac-diamide synthase [Dethiosulfovibrio peptidovorans DSM 11002]|uniref:Cobyrinic acid ac-diamide synthase n=1 Tax=Dethiosulfovibrio peptidovorans DSM 11002 TaxID=469381 RepID=D2Z694_9BACT|nr:ParA family protein [Dethiosulfovibrio peptidovorans]EFC90991.1 Cobyrinic acid ac-diamide synthase [Dethiosulfovibrio peptidovorans DSM 11002]